MFHRSERYDDTFLRSDAPETARSAPGKSTLTSRLVGHRSTPPPIQLVAHGAGDPGAGGDLHAQAAAGVAGEVTTLPHLAAIQTAFGHHDVSGVRAHTDQAAATATSALGALAYASGNDIAFAVPSPDLHTAAHEAAHVVQQRAGVQLKDGVGTAGDPYEVHADAVADAVVRGDSAAHLLDAMAGTGQSATGAGGHAVQRQAAAGGAAADPGAAMGLAQAPESDGLTASTARVAQAAAKSHEQILKLRGGRSSPQQIATVMVDIVNAAVSEVTVLAQAHQRANPGGLRGMVRGMLDRSAGANDAPSPVEEVRHAKVIASLDALYGDALEVARGVEPGGPESATLAGALGALGVAATGLGWTRPNNLEGARARSFARIACPAGENDESPNQCMLTDGERADRRAKVIRSLNRLAEAFFKLCKEKAAEFQRSFDDDQRLAELVAEFAVDLIVGVVTGGAGAVVTGVIAKVHLPASADEFARGFAKSLTETAITKAPGKLGASTELPDARLKTVSALDALAARFSAQVDASISMLEALDDDELILLQTKLDAYDKSQIKAYVARFADAYRKQVAPIGIENPGSPNLFEDDGLYRADKKAVPRAAKIVMRDGKVRLALVDEITDQRPSLRKGARSIAVAADRAIGDKDDPLITGSVYRQRQNEFINEAAVERYFIRWIDDPRMAAMAGADADTVPADKVLGLPLDAMFGLDQTP